MTNWQEILNEHSFRILEEWLTLWNVFYKACEEGRQFNMPLWLPMRCKRNRKDCEPISNIVSDDGVSFICCGLNNPKSRKVPEDRFRVCWKNNYVDEISNWDERDIKDTITVLAQALSVDANMKTSEEGDG